MADIEHEAPIAAPKIIVPKPDKAVLDAAVAALEVEKKTKLDRMKAISHELDEIKEGRSGFSEKMKAAKVIYNELSEKKKQLHTERNQLKIDFEKAKGAKDNYRESQKSLSNQLPFKTVKEIEDRIRQLETDQHTKSMSLTAEKNLIKEIESLQLAKKNVAKFAAQQGKDADFNASMDDIRAAMKAKSAEIEAVTEDFNKQKAVMDAIRADSDVGGRDLFPTLLEEKKSLKARVDEVFSEIRALRDQFKKDNDLYYEGVRAAREAKKAAREAEDAARKAEYDAKVAEYEAEMAKIHPYQDEMDMAQALVVFLEKTFAKELAAAVAAKPTTTTAAVELDGMKPLKRDDEEFFSVKKTAKKGGAGKKAKKETKLVLPIAQIQSFASLGLTPPALVSNVEESISAIKAKNEWFKAQTVRADAPAVVAAPSSPKKKANKKANGAFDQGAFPSLSGAATFESSESAWGPGIGAPVAVESEQVDDDEAHADEE
ncbi:hypothetical protein SPRG_10363 [Saprolegnia parasitica CBS 223.65]|uniref:Uncharacterized protein n=1 Tax=Saprolegnia parasitica (strain CBS 223.65) TaxID=695850 RepID=A0A067C1Y9_SAPPC|nr:hypothetical protein SPRG_10363 [Saprolegnia parasitica CBS 223.65]KDO24548.1 hypothetical protein SPRG_10363 [Saprolegnia parasitica CBS 223.65]|eukprot:XP_012204809.1 hypothetical protein SPRG_10363 [Saprolegnia parasitica CBS 223.65]